MLIKHFDGDLKVLIVLVGSEEDSTEGAHTEHLSLGVDVVVLFELVHALLLVALARLNLAALNVCLHRLVSVCGV